MRKTKAQEGHEERIREMMMDAGIYEMRYELQIEQTADTMTEIDEIKAIIKKEGRTVTEMKTAGVGAKSMPHPLYTPLQNLQTMLIRQFASLGLNKLSEKKAETKEAKKQETDGVMGFYQRKPQESNQ